MNVLSLFDGMSCMQIALNRIGMTPTKYYAAEIDKPCITVTQANYPNTEQLGSITEWRSWDIDWSSINLVSGGFPCQSWSVAGKQLGDKDERGMLFWVMLDIIAHAKTHNPNVLFFMENVKMKKEFEEYITHHTEQALGEVCKTLINSALVSAQNRNRYYWTNWHVEQPEDKGIVLADIIENGFLASASGGNLEPKILCGAIRGRYLEDGKTTEQKLELRKDEKTNTLTTVQKDNQVVSKESYRINASLPFALTETRTEEAKRLRAEHRKSTGKDFSPRRAKELKPRVDGKMNCLTATFNKKEHMLVDVEYKYRKLTPLECERLQTVPDNYTNHVSNTQRYKMLGNAFTVDVIAHILKQQPVHFF